jgi:transcriptional regulator with XRE-family HTH domain
VFTKPKPDEAVTPQQVMELRAVFDGSQEKLAKALHVSVRRLRRWEAGTAVVPRRPAAKIRYMLAYDARYHAAKRDGIEGCGWLAEREDAMWAAFAQRRWRETTKLEREIEGHPERCPACTQTREWAATQPPLPPDPPLFRGAHLVYRFDVWTKSLPKWMRPAIYGAALIGGITFLRILVMLPLAGFGPSSLGEAAYVTVMAFVLGGLGGAVWWFAERLLRPLGRLAPYAAGTLITAVCMPLAMLAFEPWMLADASEWLLMIAASPVCGLILGYAILRHVEPDA